MASVPEKIYLAAPRGYCAGVDRAVQTVEHALDLYGAPVYVRKEIVHNKHVVEQLRDRGAIFVDQETEVPEGSTGEVPGHIVLIETEEDVDALEVDNPDKLAYLTQTTLSVDETRAIINRLRARF